MNSQRSIFLTGATGALGRYILRDLLNERARVFILIRKENQNEKLKKLKDFLKKEGIQEKDFKKVVVIDGDITKKLIGLTKENYHDLVNQVTSILHCASNTNFSLSLEDARSINVGGTKKILKLAQDCKNLRSLGYLSTIYVSGKREGLIKEDELIDKGFVNFYEQSKFEAEKVLKNSSKLLPISIYRLSTIIGDSRDGYIPGFNSVHKALRLYFSGLAPMVPGIPSNSTELLDVDYASRSIVYLFTKKFRLNKTYHIMSGSEFSYTLKELIEETGRLFTKLSPKWKLKGIEKPPIVSQETFELFEKSVYEAQDKIMLGIIRIMNYFVPHLSMKAKYDTANTDKDLDSLMTKKHTKEYYEKIINYCINSNWGRLNYDPGTI